MDNNSNDGWEAAPQGAVSLQAKMLANDAALQANHPNWPTGGTAQQLQQESNFNPNAVSVKGAQGMVQAMPDTKAAVEKQMGRKLDFSNINDQLAFHRYLMNQNLDRANGDLNTALSLYNSGRATPDNPETKNYVNKFDQKMNVDSPSNDGWESAPSASSDAGWESAPSKQPDAAQQRGQAAINAMRPDTTAIGNAVTGLGETGAQMASGMFGQAAGALHGAADLLQGQSYDQAKADLNQEREAVTYNPRTQAGQQISQNVGEMMDKYMTQPLEQGGQAVGEAFGFTPEQSKAGAEIGTSLFENIGLPGLLHGAAPKGAGAEVAGAPADAVGKFAPDEAAAPSAQFTAEQPANMGPNEGPQRGAFTVDSAGNVDTGLEPSTEQQYQAATLAKQRALDEENPNSGPQLPKTVKYGEHPDNYPMMINGDTNYFQTKSGELVSVSKEPSNDGGVSAPGYTPGEADSASFVARNRQGDEIGRVNFSPNDPAIESEVASEYRRQGIGSVLYNLAENHGAQIAGHEDMGTISPDAMNLRRSLATRGDMTSHVDAYREAIKNRPAEQLDMFGIEAPEQEGPIGSKAEGNQVVPELPRSLSSDEFGQIIQDLAEKDGTRFPMPDDVDSAYSKYLDTVRDEQGGLFDRPSIARNFVDAATKEALDRRINEHPTVKANQARLDHLMQQDQSVPGVARATEAARDTLQTSQKNIGKFFEKTADAATPFYAKDGTVHMYTFGYLPELMKSLGAILKGIHGVVFKTLDRMIPSFKNLDSPGKIMGQGIKNFVNKEATRDWSQTVNAKPIAQLSKVAGLRDAVTELNPHAQEELSPEELKNQFNTAPDLSSSKVGNALRNNILQGGLLLSDFSQHPLVKYVTDSVAKSFRNADKWARENLLNPKNGLGPMIKRMSSQEFTEIRTLMEAYEGTKEFSENELRGRGYGDKQVEYYKRSLELQKETFTKWNESRQAIGLPAMDPRMAHIAAYFTGDFKQIVKDSAGRVIAVLGHNNRAALGVIAKRFQEMHPDGDNLDMGKPELRRGSSDDNTFNGYMNILDHLSKNNADIQRLVDVYRDTQMASINKLSQMANRGKFKSNPSGTVGGAEGSKLWQSMEKNAQDGGKQQLKYLESVNRWSEFQKAMQKSQDFIQDPEVNAPNAKAVSQRYLDNQMHRNLGDLNKFTNSFVNGFSDITGVGPSQLRSLSSLTKTGLLNVFVGLGKLSHSLVTSLQPLIGSPEVTSVLKARGAGFSPIEQFTSVLKGLNSVKDILQAAATGKQISDPFVRAASAYAKANDTFNTSQFNMGSVAHPSTKLGTALHINVTVPESGARAATYMRYVHLLKDASDRAPIGQKLSDQEIFGTAHNAVQKVMADYNREAQAPVFAKLGFLGDLTRMLTTFKMNQISQAATAGKMLRQGQITPMVTMLASSLAASGLRGFIGYNIANGLLGQVTTWATKQGIMTQPTNLDQMILHMLHGKSQGLADALNFGATSALGIDMTGSLSHADDIPDDPLGTLIPQAGTIGKALGSAVQFAEHPNAQRGKALVYDVAPNSFKGVMENSMFTDAKGNYYDPHTGNLVANRSPTDQAKRAATFRPLDESKMRLEAEVGKGQNQQLDAVKSEISKRMLSDADSKSLTQQAMHQYAQQYFQAGGDPKELGQQLQTHLGLNKNLNIEQREAGIPKNFTGAERYQRAQGLK